MQKLNLENVTETVQLSELRKNISNKEVFIILDSNGHITKGHQATHLLTILAGKMGRYNAKLVLPRIVLKEVSKVTRTSQNKILKRIFKIYNKTLLLADNDKIRAEAKRLETHFYECHAADSIILATAKIMCGILVTNDRKLLRTAELEGVQAYSVKEFLKHWSVMN